MLMIYAVLHYIFYLRLVQCVEVTKKYKNVKAHLGMLRRLQTPQPRAVWVNRRKNVISKTSPIKLQTPKTLLFHLKI